MADVKGYRVVVELDGEHVTSVVGADDPVEASTMAILNAFGISGRVARARVVTIHRVPSSLIMRAEMSSGATPEASQTDPCQEPPVPSVPLRKSRPH